MRLRMTLCAVLLCFVAMYSVAAPPSAFLGTWRTKSQRIDFAGVTDSAGKLADFAYADLKVTEDSPGKGKPILDGQWTSVNPETKATATGYMHGTLSSNGQQWKGVWWGNGPNEHGEFTFTLGAGDSFTGTFTAANHADHTPPYYWNSVLKYRTK